MPTRISVRVRPQAKKENVEKLSANEYKVSLQAPPAAGKANERLIELMAEYFSVAKSSVRILRGRTSRKKLVEIG